MWTRCCCFCTVLLLDALRCRCIGCMLTVWIFHVFLLNEDEEWTLYFFGACSVGLALRRPLQPTLMNCYGSDRRRKHDHPPPSICTLSLRVCVTLRVSTVCVCLFVCCKTMFRIRSTDIVVVFNACRAGCVLLFVQSRTITSEMFSTLSDDTETLCKHKSNCENSVHFAHLFSPGILETFATV